MRTILTTTEANENVTVNPNYFYIHFINGGNSIESKVTYKENATTNFLIGTAAKTFLDAVARKSFLIDTEKPLIIRVSYGNQNLTIDSVAKMEKATYSQATKMLRSLVAGINTANDKTEIDIFNKSALTKSAIKAIAFKAVPVKELLN